MYSSSKSWDQWTGKAFGKADLDKCEPMETDSDGKVYAPCGAVSMSIFNDTYSFDSTFPKVLESGITPKNYRKLFKALGSSWDSDKVSPTLNEDLFPGNQSNDHFINWALIAAFPTFRKMWGKIDSDKLEHGKYQLTINNIYPSKSYGGKKKLVFAEVNWMGGRNRFIGIFFLVVCGLSVLAAVVFAVLHFTNALPLYKAIIIEQATTTTMPLN